MVSEDKMILISVHLPKQMLQELDELVRQGKFPSRSEAIRVAVRDLILKENELKQRELELRQILIPGR
jgi:Arc/MetJ-type ribon-helix-helix transcriptional regulator